MFSEITTNISYNVRDNSSGIVFKAEKTKSSKYGLKREQSKHSDYHETWELLRFYHLVPQR